MIASNGWAERLKMYLKTPRSRFSRNSKDRRSKSPESKRESNSSKSDPPADKREKTGTPNQPPKIVAKSRSSTAATALAAVPLERQLVLDSPERKKKRAFESAGVSSSGGANHMYTSPPPTTTSLSAPKKNHSGRIYIDTEVRSPEENYADENSRSERKMTPLPQVSGSKQRRRWSPPPARQMFGDENIKLKSTEADDGRKALSRLNLKIEKFGKKKSRNGPVVSRFFSSKK